MAQTGYTPILIYSSSTTSNIPAAGNLTNSTLGSELAINITDGKLFYKDNANAVQVIAWKTTPTTAGGTGLTSYTAGDLLYYATGTTLSKLAIGASKTILTSSGTAPQWSTSLDTTQGGTGLTSYTAGDLPYFATGTALSKLAIGANTYVLTSNGTAPVWTAPSSVAIGTATNLAGGAAGSVPYQSGAGATTFVSIGSAYQALQVNAGGTAPSWQASATSTLTAQGDLLYASAANTLARLAKNTTATRYLSNTGSNNDPAWAQVNLANGVTGVLPVANGGTNASSASITAFNNITGYTASGATGTTSTNLVFSTSPTLTTPIVTTTIGVGNATPSASGSGITFPAVQSASTNVNTLDDYEEGTFTPTIYGLTTPGTTTYAAQAGYYTKIGNLVVVEITLSYSAITGTGRMEIGGLPFTSGSGSSQYSTGTCMTANVNWTAGTMLTTFLPSATTGIRIYGSADDGAGGYQDCVNETGEIYITMSYLV